MKIRKGDSVKIIVGKDSGKTGKVAKVMPQNSKVLLDGLNLYKKHVRPKRQGEKGEIVNIPRPMDVSNVALVCPSCKEPTRIGQQVEGEKKWRICKKCQATL